MKKTANKKRVSARKQKIRNDRRPFGYLPEMFMPFGFSYLPEYPLVFDRRTNLTKHLNEIYLFDQIN